MHKVEVAPPPPPVTWHQYKNPQDGSSRAKGLPAKPTAQRGEGASAGERDTSTSGARVYGDGEDQVDNWCEPCGAPHCGIPLCKGGRGRSGDRKHGGLAEVADGEVMVTVVAVMNVDRALVNLAAVWDRWRRRGR